MGGDCTAIGMDVQPISVPSVCYLADVEQKDPKDYLWTNIVKAVGLSAGTTQTVWSTLNKRGKRIPRGNLQRIEEGGMPTTKALMEIAKALDVELWTLLMPPAQEVSQIAPAPRVEMGLEGAIQVVAQALSDLEEKDRAHVLDTLARYAADPSKKPSTLEYLRQELGGGRPQQKMLKHAS